MEAPFGYFPGKARDLQAAPLQQPHGRCLQPGGALLAPPGAPPTSSIIGQTPLFSRKLKQRWPTADAARGCLVFYCIASNKTSPGGHGVHGVIDRYAL